MEELTLQANTEMLGGNYGISFPWNSIKKSRSKSADPTRVSRSNYDRYLAQVEESMARNREYQRKEENGSICKGRESQQA